MAILVGTEFYGRYDLTMDTKGRVPVPAGFRKGLAQQGEEHVVLSLGPEPGLRGYTDNGFQALLGRILEMSDREIMRKLKRQLLSRMARLTFDSQGRILIPPHLRTVADLAGEVVYLGCGEYFELWNRARWDAVNEQDETELLENNTAVGAVFG